jgi:thioredoxin 1
MRRSIGWTLAASLLAPGLALAAQTAPHLAAGQAAPTAHPYDTNADVHQAVDAAFTRAKAEHKTVLIDFGGNWCPDCRMVGGVLDQPAMKPWLDKNFVLVMVDVGRMNKNQDIAARFGQKIHAVPTVLAVTPDGKLLNPQNPTALSDARHLSDQAVADQLAAWAP